MGHEADLLSTNVTIFVIGEGFDFLESETA